MSAQIIPLPAREPEPIDQRAREHEGDDYPVTTPGALDSPLGRFGFIERWMSGSSKRTGCVLGALLLIILAAASIAP